MVDRLAEQLAPAGWRQHRLVPHDEVAFIRAPSTEVVFHLSVNLAGDGGISLTPALGVEHAGIADLQRRLFRRTSTVCQVGATMGDLLREAATPNITPLRWWVASPERAEEAVAQVVADLTTYGEPFLVGNQTLSAMIETLVGRPKSQVEYGTLAVCLAVSGDLPGARAMLTNFDTEPRVFVEEVTKSFIRTFRERFGE
ncbi:hypothetical protein ACFYPH_17295 [Micromonospora sp. NPDC005252]|uniref:hypothetical protein n=1 Tax=Micromonospora sp. NPDC005252 TaxID=3364228 RepID=UPI0036BA06D9